MANQDVDSLLREAQALGEAIREMESIDTELAYRKGCRLVRQRRFERMRVRLMQIAAVLCLPLLAASLTMAYFLFAYDDTVDTYAEVTAVPASVVRYELPDKSCVWLSGGSTLRYPTSFNKENRRVEIVGEAYFDVHSDAENPFYVRTPGDLVIQVYGTQFNVSAYADDRFVETVLEKGKVRVVTPENKEADMEPGDLVLYDICDKNLVKSRANIYEKTAWKDGKMVFRNATLEEIFKRLERHFNVDIEFQNKQGKEYRYRATFRNETLTQILDYLAQSAALKWEIVEDESLENIGRTKMIVKLY